MAEFSSEQRAAIDKEPYPWNIRQEMGITLMNLMDTHPDNGQWKHGLAGVPLLLNSASHWDGKRALQLVGDDLIAAHQRETPIEIVQIALRQVFSWRKTMLKTQPRVEKTIGSITRSKLRRELQAKLPAEYLDQILS